MIPDKFYIQRLLDLLCKLNIKSAFPASLSLSLQAGQSLQVEDLGAVLRVVTFDDKLLKYWPSIKK